MSVRHSLLAILAAGETHGYGLKSTFEESTAGAWPLNVGQVYQTLARLERDGLVEAEGIEGSERQTWKLTKDGKKSLAEWYRTPVVEESPSRDELAIKVLLAVAADSVDVAEVLAAQRAATMEHVQRLTRQKAKADPATELPWLLLLDSMILKAEAELRWLDLCEQRLKAKKKR
jgi:DNA-binding PadR family transcriptional regulator